MTTLRNLEELKGSTAWEIENIDQKTLKHVFLSLMKGCRKIDFWNINTLLLFSVTHIIFVENFMLFNFNWRYFYRILSFKQDTGQKLFWVHFLSFGCACLHRGGVLDILKLGITV